MRAPGGGLEVLPLAGEGGWCSPLRAGRLGGQRWLVQCTPHSLFCEKRECAVHGGREKTGARLNERRSRNDFPRDFRLSGGLSDIESTSFSFRWRYPGRGIGLMVALSVWPPARQLPQRGSQVGGAAFCLQWFPKRAVRSPGRPACLSLEGSPFAWQTHLPLPLGEVARRSRDGEGPPLGLT